MGINVPKLDDTTFAQLIEEAKKRIPQYNAEWTDHNLHDPGITLIELFAWLTEMQVFSLDQVTEKDKRKFLKLLGNALKKNENLNDAIFETQKDLKKPYRAVTIEDYEYLAKNTPGENIARAQAYWANDRVQVIIGVKSGPTSLAKAGADVKKRVCMHLDKGRLLTTLIDIVDPEFVPVTVQATVIVKPLSSSDAVKQSIILELETFLNPLVGYWDKNGWPFGRNVYKSEVTALIEGIEGVDCVQSLTLSAKGNFTLENGNIKLNKHALVYSDLPKIDIAGSEVPCRRFTL